MVAAGLLQSGIDKLAHAFILFKISLDKFLGLALFNAKLLRQAKGRKTVDNAEVHRLGAAAVLGVDHHGRHAEDLRGGERVDIVSAAKRLH